jgi:hypothetical protein
MKAVDMIADNPGTWLFHCHVADHMMEGMYAAHVVHGKRFPSDGASIGDPLFSQARTAESLWIKSAQVEVDFSWGAKNPVELRAIGQVSFSNLPRFDGTEVELRIGSKGVSLRLNSSGKSEN